MPEQNDGRFLDAAECAPVTTERPYRTDTDKSIKRPYIARANCAPSFEKPHGSVEHTQKYEKYTVMQQHIMFWDRDHDGIIWPTDTYIGFRELGFNILFSLLSTLIINFFFSLPTRLAHSYVPDPCFRVYVSSIHKDKHGSDSGIYDAEGRFIPSRFEDLFTKYSSFDKSRSLGATQPSTSLSLRELFQMMHGQRVAADPFGWFAAVFEWGSTWLLIQQDGRVDKEDLRRVYDGSLFHEIRKQRQTKAGWNKGWGLGGDGFWGGKKVLSFSL